MLEIETYALSSIVKAEFNLMFLKENQSPLLKAKQKQHTSACVEEMTERKKCFSMELKNKDNFFGTQMQYKSRKRYISKISWISNKLQKIVLLISNLWGKWNRVKGIYST